MNYSIYLTPLLVSFGLYPASGQDFPDTASKKTVEVPAQYEAADQRSPVNEGAYQRSPVNEGAYQRSPVNEGAYQRSPVNEGAYQRQGIEVGQYGTVEVPAEYGTVEVPAEYGIVEGPAIYLGDDVWQTSDGLAVSIAGAAAFGIQSGDKVQIWEDEQRSAVVWEEKEGRSEKRGGGHSTAIIAGLQIWEDEQRNAVVWEEKEGRSEKRGGGHMTAIIAGLEIWEDEQRNAVVWEEEEGRSEKRGGGHITAIIAGRERGSIQGYIAPTKENPVGVIIVDPSAE